VKLRCLTELGNEKWVALCGPFHRLLAYCAARARLWAVRKMHLGGVVDLPGNLDL